MQDDPSAGGVPVYFGATTGGTVVCARAENVSVKKASTIAARGEYCLAHRIISFIVTLNMVLVPMVS